MFLCILYHISVFHSSYYPIIFHYTNMPHFVYPSIHQLMDISFHRMELMSHMLTICLKYWGTTILFSKVTVPCYTHASRRLPLSPPSCGYLLLSFFFFFNYSHSSECEVAPHCGFDLHFLINNFECFPMCSLTICISFEKCLFKFLAKF